MSAVNLIGKKRLIDTLWKRKRFSLAITDSSIISLGLSVDIPVYGI